ncbi:MAG: methyltransferase domain-containing protein [Sedimentisphaerales bacterium]|nr:methyltransferase domain-containing protein [Sedimentisphaerales bacterium]
MAETELQNVRGIAAKILTETRKDKQFAAETLERYPEIADRPRATDLIFGVIRNRGVLDAVVEKVSGLQIIHIQAKLLNIIRVGAYELIFCPHIPEHSTVHQSVDYAKQITNDKSAGFVNWILRSVQKHIISRQRPLIEINPRKIIPQTPEFGCEFDIELLPDGDASIKDYLSVAFSLPVWLIESWLAEFGPDQTRDICLASNRRPGIYARPNPLKTTDEAFAANLKAGSIDSRIIAGQQMVKLISHKAIPDLPGFEEGLFTIQDLSAAQVVRFLDPQPDWFILDLCAAPGTKTTQLAEATGGKAKIIATDIDKTRLEMVKENISRLGLSDCITTIEYPALDGFFGKGGFDCVLVDSPCSNTGVLARRPEVRHRIKQTAIAELTTMQAGLLSKAAGFLKPGGIICYSTCSLQPEENGLVIRSFLQQNSALKLKAEQLILPSAKAPDHDGSYTAVIVKG